MTLAARLAGKTAAETISVSAGGVRSDRTPLRKSITFDNDTAFAQHACCEPCAPGDHVVLRCLCLVAKGCVRNANGFDYAGWLPRHIDIDQVSDEETVQDIVITANLTPQKMPASRPLSRRSSKSLAKTCKSGLHRPGALGSRIQARFHDRKGRRLFLPSKYQGLEGEGWDFGGWGGGGEGGGVWGGRRGLHHLATLGGLAKYSSI